MKKKKILIRIGSLRHGGAEKVLVTFLKNLPADKYEIDLLLNLYSGKYLAEVPAWIKVHYLNRGEMITTNRLQDLPVKVWRVLWQKLLSLFPGLLYRFILKNAWYDVEFAAIHGMRDEILDSPQKHSKKIIWIHNDLTKTEFHKYTTAELRKFFGFDKILVISKKIEDDFWAVAKSEAEQRKILRIANPLDTAEILRLSKANIAIDSTKIMSEAPLFIAIGTVFPQKGFDRLLRAHRKLLDDGFPHRLKILGDGYDFNTIQNLLRELGADQSAAMAGFTEDPYPELLQADYFVLSSRYEGFPTVLCEALTLKKNIIATEVSGVREILEDGRLGLIVDNSEEGIYTGMKTALSQPETFSKFQTELQEYQLPFDLHNSVTALMDVLDDNSL